MLTENEPPQAEARFGATPPESARARAKPDWSPQFQALYDEQFALVWRGLARLGTPDASLEDAVQDVFLVVHRKYAEFAGRSSLTTWIYGIAVRVAKDHRRKETRHRRRVREFEQSVRHEAQRGDSPAELVLQREAARVVMGVLDRLPQEQRELLVLVELEQLPLTEAANALGVSVRTAQRRLQHARIQFEALLEAEPPSSSRQPNPPASRAML